MKLLDRAALEERCLTCGHHRGDHWVNRMHAAPDLNPWGPENGGMDCYCTTKTARYPSEDSDHNGG